MHFYLVLLFIVLISLVTETYTGLMTTVAGTLIRPSSCRCVSTHEWS